MVVLSFLSFSFFLVLQLLRASGVPVSVYSKAFVSLSFMLHRDTECASNE